MFISASVCFLSKTKKNVVRATISNNLQQYVLNRTSLSTWPRSILQISLHQAPNMVTL